MAVAVLLTLAAWMLASGGCADPGGAGMVVPRAPELDRPDAAMLQGTMWRIAALAGRLESLVTAPEGPGPHRAEIDDLLRQLDAAMARLEAEQATADHALVSQRGGGFRADVQAARADVALEPPRFERAGAIYDACQRCHGG